jgi:hypothetical protein
VTASVKFFKDIYDRRIDPAFVALRAGRGAFANHHAEIRVATHSKAVATNCPRQSFWNMEAI